MGKRKKKIQKLINEAFCASLPLAVEVEVGDTAPLPAEVGGGRTNQLPVEVGVGELINYPYKLGWVHCFITAV